jgi:CheY-like chemotaxis protein
MAEKLKVLYVDDEPDIRTIVEMAFALDPAIEVRLASSGQHVLEMLQQGAWIPDLALIDMLMPGMTGTDVMAALRERGWTANIPIVFVTASAWQKDIDRFVEAGALGIIAKPFDPLTLAETVRSFAEQAKRE